MNVARLIYIGTGKMGLTEESIMRMTPRKFFKIYNQFLIVSGVRKEGDEYAIDMLP